MFAAINFLLAIFVWFFIPETKGVKLEDMDTIFGGVNHADKGAALVHDAQGNVIHGKTIHDNGGGLTIEELEIHRADQPVRIKNEVDHVERV